MSRPEKQHQRRNRDVGLVTWSLLNWQAQYWLHTPSALEQIRAQVPMQLYDRSTFLFFTALVMDVLNILFERQTTKLDYVLLPAFVKGMATTSNLVVRFGAPSVAFTTLGRPFMVQRYVCWAHTTPTLLMLVRLISSSISHPQFLTVLAWDETMLLTGVLALITTGWLQALFIIITHVALLPIIPYLHKGFYEAIQEVTSQNTRRLMWAIFGLNVLLWATFGITWDLAFLDLINLQQEETLYIICDFSAKILFSSTLMLSSFKSMEGRREATMRHIEEGSKQKLIEELRHLLEQKERFMSSVSHELRTPLNGIIGISEGMLSGCCGALSEHTRRQVYIIRTSGARLLALINDVMDASALKQNKLVLKQEQVIVLRHVVDDVLDLTRSLVDQEVELHNAIAPRITVQGDTGRLVQILNNLLGNAAKFTRRGFIKVSARSVDSGSWVAITVQDTGIGVPQSKLAHIFLPFEQVDMSISRKYGGFGLGLNIVQVKEGAEGWELVKAHGGEIWVESTEGKGSTFTFTMMSGQPKTSLDGERSPSEACMTLAERTDWPSTEPQGQRQMPWASKSTGNLEHRAAATQPAGGGAAAGRGQRHRPCVGGS
ncbi:hypothetical protein QJQ45_019551 [Haematococcus lacustris]|nr:hypothetical protein QJQ45_019551 [Haematococcus lacustris]